MCQKQNNLKVYGPFTQRDFLFANGIKERKKKILLKANKKEKNIIEKGYIRLTANNEMGKDFKCFIVSNFKIYNEHK